MSHPSRWFPSLLCPSPQLLLFAGLKAQGSNGLKNDHPLHFQNAAAKNVPPERFPRWFPTIAISSGGKGCSALLTGTRLPLWAKQVVPIGAGVFGESLLGRRAGFWGRAWGYDSEVNWLERAISLSPHVDANPSAEEGSRREAENGTGSIAFKVATRHCVSAIHGTTERTWATLGHSQEHVLMGWLAVNPCSGRQLQFEARGPVRSEKVTGSQKKQGPRGSVGRPADVGGTLDDS